MVPVIYCATDSFLTFWAIFWSLTLLTTWKIKILKKWKKHLEILSFYTCVPQITIIWGMVPDTWSSTDQILSFWVIFCPFTQNMKNQNFEKMTKALGETSFYACLPQMTIIWYMVPENGAWQTELFLILDHFLPFKPWELRKSKFWKNEKKGWTSSFYVSVPKIIGAPLKKTPR